MDRELVKLALCTLHDKYVKTKLEAYSTWEKMILKSLCTSNVTEVEDYKTMTLTPMIVICDNLMDTINHLDKYDTIQEVVNSLNWKLDLTDEYGEGYGFEATYNEEKHELHFSDELFKFEYTFPFEI